MKSQLARTIQLLGFILMLSSKAGFAQDAVTNSPLEGIWKWTFTMPDGSQVLPRLELKLEDGELTGSTRIRAGTEAPITNLVVQGNEVSFQVRRERDGREVVTRYAGTLSSNTIKGTMASNWNGEEQTYPWEARRLAGAAGVWKWSVAFGGGGGFRADSTLTLKQEGEKLVGKLSAGRAGDSEIKKGKFKSGHISFETEREREGETFTNRYYGKLSGDKIQGHMELNFFGQPRTNKWEALRVD
jgi:hypothetical protein